MKLTYTLFFLFLSISTQAAELITLDTRDGVQQKFILIKPDKPVASVILFAGGKGALDLQGSSSMNWGENNFLVRTRDMFASQGFAVAVVDAPSDRHDEQGMLGGFRDSEEHVIDIDEVINYLKTEIKLPVWLVGTSRGTESATKLAIFSQQEPRGLVLTSSMVGENANGAAVTEMNLESITIPTLIVSHLQDGCRHTPHEGADVIKGLLENSKKVEVKKFDGGDEISSNPCNAKTYHGFLDIEEDVVKYISKFIKEN